jgi:hypothetical protein
MSAILSAWVEQHWASILIALVLGGLATYPIWSFYQWGWVWRRDDIVSFIKDDAKVLYLKLFFRREDVKLEEAADKYLSIYNKWYGRHHLIVPIIQILILVTVQSYFLAELGLRRIFPSAGYLETVDPIAAAGFAGAYLFVVTDLIGRNWRKDITSADLLLSALRIALATAVGYAFSYLVKDELGVVIAFAAGAFPISTVQLIFKRVFTRYIDIGSIEDARTDRVVKLSGVDPTIADKIEACGITTISQLAYCDPVNLTMQTNLSYSFVMDIVGQSLAWNYLEEKMQILRQSGLRGAVEIANLCRDLEGEGSGEKASAQAILQELAATTKIPEASLRHALREIAGDPYTKFLEKCW